MPASRVDVKFWQKIRHLSLAKKCLTSLWHRLPVLRWQKSRWIQRDLQGVSILWINEWMDVVCRIHFYEWKAIDYNLTCPFLLDTNKSILIYIFYYTSRFIIHVIKAIFSPSPLPSGVPILHLRQSCI